MTLSRLSQFVKQNSLVFKEALGSSSFGSLSMIDSDDYLFRRLDQRTRDLGSVNEEKQREIAFHLSDTNPHAKRIINMTRDFIVGDSEEWQIQAGHDKIRDLLNAHWNDPINDWGAKLESRVRELGLSGEQCYTAKTGPDGIVRLAYVDPGFIAAVRRDPKNLEIMTEVILKKDPGEKDKKLKVINYDMDEGRMVGIRTDGAGKPTKGFLADGTPFDDTVYEGQCFFWAINKPINATRGRSDLFAMADSLDMLDRFHWNRMERSALINAFIFDITCKGMTKEEIEAYAKNQTPPRPGSRFYHNEQIEMEAVAPNLNAGDAAEEGRMMRVPVQVGSGLPEHWLFGVGDNANRASAYEMGDPPIRMLTTRQLFVLRMLYRIFRFQVDEANEMGLLSGVPPDKLYDFSMNVPGISSRDMVRASSVLTSVAQALLIGLTQKILSWQRAVEVFAFALSQMGLEVDAEDELKRIEDEMADQDAEDMGGLDLPGSNGQVGGNGQAGNDAAMAGELEVNP
jgi:hypothetical protein